MLEINPVTLEILWQYTPQTAGFAAPFQSHYFYSPLVSSAQRLANGNTLITEGCSGRIIEVTADKEIVWEYINPYFDQQNGLNLIYRAYRYPYSYVPQLTAQEEVAIAPVDNTTFRLPGAADAAFAESVTVSGTTGYETSAGFCVSEEK